MAGSQPGPMFIKEEIKDQDEAESFETRYDALEMLSESHFVTSLVCDMCHAPQTDNLLTV